MIGKSIIGKGIDTDMTSKLLVLDGISGVPLGREIAQVAGELGVNTAYQDLASMPKIPFYRLRSIYAKTLNKQKQDEGFFHLPRVQSEAVVELLEHERPTHILVIGFLYKFISPRLMQTLAQRYQCQMFLYDTDSCNLYSKRREFIFFLEDELRTYQHVFSFSRVMTDFFQRARGLDASYSPYGALPIALPAVSQQKNDVLFVGSGDLRRIFMLENIREQVTIFGKRWERNHALMSPELKQSIVDQDIWGTDLHQAFADSKIILNITRAQFFGAETGINLRIFEALAAGCFLLTDYCDEVAELFQIGVELETFKSSSELVEKVNYYLANPDKRVAIARQGHAAFQQRFTWNVRVQALLNGMGLAQQA